MFLYNRLNAMMKRYGMIRYYHTQRGDNDRYLVLAIDLLVV